MHFTTADITAFIGAYLWPFFRIAAVVTAMPVIGSRMVPMRVRLVFALLLTLVIAPVLGKMEAPDPLSAEGLMIILQQVLIGLSMGFALHLVYSVFLVAAQIISMQMGLGFATMMDPQSESHIPVIGQFFTIVVTLAFLAMNGHLHFIEMVADSFKTLPVSSSGLDRDVFWTMAMWGGDMFAGAVMVSLPAITALLLVNISFGVMTRAAPQLNIFAVGFPISLVLGFIIIYFALPGMTQEIGAMFGKGFDLIARITGGG